MTELLKDISLVQEDYRVEDLLDFSELRTEFRSRVDRIKKSAIVGLVGKFGTGKSTMLHSLRLAGEEKGNEKWFEFDAWKYPERRDMWEGFVLDVAAQYGNGQKKKILKKVVGKETKSVWFDIGTDIMGLVSDVFDFNLLDKFSEFFKRSPATRVFELQGILKSLLLAEKKDIYIIVEDIDRSGDMGVYFLETLRYFVRTELTEKRVIIIVPVGSEIWEDTKRETAYAKCLDYYFPFQLQRIDFSNYLHHVLNEDLIQVSNSIAQINFLLRQISARGLVIRDIKRILRIAAVDYARFTENKTCDFRVFLFFIVLRYMRMTLNITHGDTLVASSTDLGGQFLIWVANSIDVKQESDLEKFVKMPIRLVSDNDLDIPRIPRFDRENAYLLSDKYLSILN